MIQRLSVFLLLVMTLSFSMAWEPMDFQVYCGEPYAETGISLDVIVETFLAKYSPPLKSTSYQFYKELFGVYDIDKSGDEACVSTAKKEQIEEYAKEILAELKLLGFASPSPKRLGPVVSTPQGPVVRLYAVASKSGYGSTTSPCLKSGVFDDSQLSFVKFGSEKLNNVQAAILYYIVAHELVHVVQNAQEALSKSNQCGLPGWIAEGTADAIATYLTQKRFNYNPPIVEGPTSIGKSMYGLRSYKRNLAWTDSKKLSYYRTSSFWRYLAQRYYGNNLNYISEYLAIPGSVVDRDDWFLWLDVLLETHESGPKKPLYLVFPDFVANYANWGKLKFPHIGEKAWLREGFGGCHSINLSPQQPVRGLNLKLEPISAQCIKVTVGGVSAGDIVNVKFMTYDETTDNLDNLHLSTAYLAAKISGLGGDFNCYRDSKKYPNGNCADRPFTVATSPNQNSLGEFAKTWRSETQEVVQSNFENLYMFSHVPLIPSQQKHANSIKQSISLQISLESATLNTKGTSKKVKATVGVMEIEETASMAMAVGMAGNENREAFMTNVADATAEFPDEGFRRIMLQEVDLGPDGIGGGPALAIGLVPVEPIEFGATGTYKAYVTGSVGPIGITGANMILSQEDNPTAQIEVHEYSEQLLRLTVSGTYCTNENFDFENEVCLNPESLHSEIIKPFGWTYQPNGFTIIDTPGTDVYKEHFYRGLAAIGIPIPLESFPSNNAPSSDSSGNSASSISVPECDCSCEEFSAFEAMTNEMQSQIDSQSQVDSQSMMSMPPAAAQMMQCLGTCMMQYATCQ